MVQTLNGEIQCLTRVRNALLALLAQHHPDQPLPALVEHFHSRPNR